MANPMEEVKGRAKEAAGAITDDKSMKHEGEAQQAKEEKKEEAERAIEQAQDAEEKQRANQ